LHLALRHGNLGDRSDDDVIGEEEKDDEQHDRGIFAASGNDDDNSSDDNSSDDDDGDGDCDGDCAGAIDQFLQPDEDVLTNLFGSVLSAHSRLEYITVTNSRILRRLFYTESFPPADCGDSLFRRMLQHTPLSMEHCQLLQRMLHRKVHLPWLALTHCKLGRERRRVAHSV
jgi:hypothetical protein